MHRYYKDIIEGVGKDPDWFDENAVPRFEPFSNDQIANIYSQECALVLIECQSCGCEFNVAFSEYNLARVRSRQGNSMHATRLGTIAEAISRGTLHYGDPPNVSCCAAGPSMNSVPKRVLEYWQRISGERMPPVWERDPSLEVEIVRPNRKSRNLDQFVVKKASSFYLFPSGPEPVAPFSHAVETGDGWVILTGQMPTVARRPDDPLAEGIEAQTRQVMGNLELILNELGLDLSHVVQCRCYLTAFERDYKTFNDTYQTFFPADRRPARTTVGVTALAVGALVEIDCIAKRPLE